jgi:hypothetical protein
MYIWSRLTQPYRVWRANRHERNRYRSEFTTHANVCSCTNASTHVVKRSGCTHSLARWDLRGPRHVRVCEPVQSMQCADGKTLTGAYPSTSFSCTDDGAETPPGVSVSSLCSRWRERVNELGSREGAPRRPRDRRSSRRRAARRPRPALQRRPQGFPNRPRQTRATTRRPRRQNHVRSRASAGSTCCRDERNHQQQDTGASRPRHYEGGTEGGREDAMG